VVIWYIVPNLVCFAQEKTGNPVSDCPPISRRSFPNIEKKNFELTRNRNSLEKLCSKHTKYIVKQDEQILDGVCI
jgi:hypothetical protein